MSLLFFWVAPSRAQINRGIVEGVVTDPQGAVVPGVDVTVTNVDTAVAYNTKTNSAGYYRAVDQVPGTYRVHFAISGFAPLDMVGIQVRAGETSKIDGQLQLGSSQQHVEVSATAALVETAASNFASDVEHRTIDEVPMQGRDLQQLVYMLPGVANVAGPPGSNFGFNSQFGTFPDPTYVQGSDVSVNGGEGGANAWFLDGNLNLSAMAENIVVNPSPDSVSEFRTVTSGLSAEYGRTGGGVFSVVLKSGSNALHGDLFEFVRNNAFDARNPFTSLGPNGQYIADRVLHFNDFGGTLGGPVVIPHLYDGKNKTFFFFSFDHSILHLNGNQVFSVPTALARTGNLSEDPLAVANGIWDPWSTQGPDSNGIYARSVFGTPITPNGCTGYISGSGATATAVNPTSSTCNFATQIPTDRLDPVAMYFMKSFPLPNYNSPLNTQCAANASGNLICNNYLGQVASSQDPFNISLKVDHEWSPRSKYFGEWLYDPGMYNNYKLPWTGPTMPYAGYGAELPVGFNNQIIAFGHTYIFNPTLINEFRASFSRQFITTYPGSGGYSNSITQLSQTQQILAPSQIPLGPSVPAPSWFVGMPYGGGTAQFGPPGWVNMLMAAEAYTLLDNVTKVMGTHTLKAGFVYRLEHAGRHISDPTSLQFDGSITTNPITKLGSGGYAQFMLGAPTSYTTQTGLVAQPYAIDNYWGFYAQDDFRVRRNLTLNYGVRWDIQGFVKTRQGPMSNFCLSCENPLTDLDGKMIYWGDPGFPNHSPMFPANKGSIGPHVNFSWMPKGSPKTVVRGGYDMFYTNAINSVNNLGQGDLPGPDWQTFNYWSQSWDPSQCAQTTFTGASGCPPFSISNTTINKGTLTLTPFPANGVLPAQTRDPALGASLQFYIRPPKDPMVQMWSFNIQRELPGNMMLDVGYVGSHGTHLTGDTFRAYNYVHTSDVLKYKTSLGAPTPITSFYTDPKTVSALEQIYGSSTLPLSTLLTSYPAFGGLFPQTQLDGASDYDALDAKLQKRFSHGLNFLAAYTWSKKIDNAQAGQMASQLFDTIHLSRGGNIGGQIGALGGGPTSGSGQGVFGGGYQNPDDRNADRALAVDDMPNMFNLVASYELPFGTGKAFLSKNRIVDGIVGGWRLTGNFNARSGTPMTINGPCDQIGNCRIDLVGDPDWHKGLSKEQRIANWFNPGAFQPAFGNDQTFWNNYDPTDPRAWLYGTAGLRLGNARTPGFWNLDSALGKDFHITESKYLEFRWELFNALNHQNLGLPNNTWCLPAAPDGTTNSVQVAGCSFGRITNIQTDPRSLEFALKLYW